MFHLKPKKPTSQAPDRHNSSSKSQRQSICAPAGVRVTHKNWANYCTPMPLDESLAMYCGSRSRAMRTRGALNLRPVHWFARAKPFLEIVAVHAEFSPVARRCRRGVSAYSRARAWLSVVVVLPRDRTLRIIASRPGHFCVCRVQGQA